MESLTEEEVARRAGTTADTLRAWVRDGLLPRFDGTWTPEIAAQARLVGRLRARGHSTEQIREAEERGRLAFGGIEHLLGATGREIALEDAARDAGLDPELAAEALRAVGFATAGGGVRIGTEDVALLRDIATALAAGLPRVALLQLLRVYGHALEQVADAEVRLFHLYVHEPLMQDGVPGDQIAEEMEDLVRGLLPLAGPILRRVHARHLRRFVAQDVVGHMEEEGAGNDGPRLPGRLRVSIAFADLAGYTRMTEELGDEEAVLAVERFIEDVERSIPGTARIVKTIGDEVMIVGSDVVALTAWAVAFQAGRVGRRPQPRIGLHCGEVLYRDGEYYGREVNLAARVAARAAGGEVLVTKAVDEAAGPGLARERIGEVRLKGFSQATELFLAFPRR